MNEDNLFTNFKIFPVSSEKAGSLVANGKCIVAGTLQVSFTIMKNKQGGLFAAFPSQKVEKNGKIEYYPHMNLVDESTKTLFQTAALAAYNDAGTAAPSPAKTPTKSVAVPF